MESNDPAHLHLEMKVWCDDGYTSYGVGTVRHIGSPPDHTEHLIGVELEDATGMNNGSLCGTEYFRCNMKYGIFLKPSQVKPLYRSVVKEYSSNGFGFVRQGDGVDVYFHITDVAYEPDTICVGQRVEHTRKTRWNKKRGELNDVAENMRLLSP